MNLEQGAPMKQSRELAVNITIIYGLESELQKLGTGWVPSFPGMSFGTCIWVSCNCHFVLSSLL
jgi:hypothetical protein